MKTTFLFLVLLSFVVLSACAGASINTAADVNQQAQIQMDNLKNETIIIFPSVSYPKVDKAEIQQYIPNYQQSDIGVVYFIKVITDSTKKTVKTVELHTELSATSFAGSPQRFTVKEILDSGKTKLNYKFVSDAAGIYGGGYGSNYYKRNYIIDLSEVYIVKYKDTGVLLSVYLENAKQTNVLFHIPTYYIQGVLDKVK
jgi:hypothetical protein